MTAKDAGKHAAGGVWTTLRRLRDHWVLLTCLATALYWARDTYDEFRTFPVRAERLEQAVDELSQEVARLGRAAERATPDQGHVLSFPGLRHSVSDGRAGDRVLVRLRPVVPSRPDCRPVAMTAYMIDAGGQWFTVDADVAGWPRLETSQELAFGVVAHPRMAVGRAQLLMQFVHLCGDHLQIDSAPRLPFRILPAAAD